MYGPFLIKDVYSFVTQISPGAYILSRDGKTAHYVGRSDSDVAHRIKRSALDGKGYLWFWFEYTSSSIKAYLLECEWFHKYKPTDNTIHPATTRNTLWKCPTKGCSWS